MANLDVVAEVVALEVALEDAVVPELEDTVALEVEVVPEDMVALEVEAVLEDMVVPELEVVLAHMEDRLV